MQFDAKIPAGALTDKWDRHRFELKLVNPANKRKFQIIVVGTGLAGASAAAVCPRALRFVRWAAYEHLDARLRRVCAGMSE